jgi:hypothetical protein
MKKVSLTLLLCAVGIVPAAHATVSFDIQADLLQTLNAGEGMPTSGVVMLLADTQSNGFGPVEAFSFTSDLSSGITADGSAGDDLVLWYSDLSSSGMNGVLAGWAAGIQIGDYGSHTLSEGDALALVWFPDVSLVDGLVGVGESYGIFDETTGSLGSQWTTPANGSSAYGLYAFSENSALLPYGENTGDLDSGILVADLSTVPEPAAASALLGIATLGLVFGRRRVKS